MKKILVKKILKNFEEKTVRGHIGGVGGCENSGCGSSGWLGFGVHVPEPGIGLGRSGWLESGLGVGKQRSGWLDSGLGNLRWLSRSFLR